MALGRKTGGRKPGSLNLRTKATQQALVVALSADGAVEDVDAIQLLQRVYRCTDVPLPVRIDCAKAALKHETPTLSSIEQRSTSEERTTRIEVVYVDRQPVSAAGPAAPTCSLAYVEGQAAAYVDGQG